MAVIPSIWKAIICGHLFFVKMSWSWIIRCIIKNIEVKGTSHMYWYGIYMTRILNFTLSMFWLFLTSGKIPTFVLSITAIFVLKTGPESKCFLVRNVNRCLILDTLSVILCHFFFFLFFGIIVLNLKVYIRTWRRYVVKSGYDVLWNIR